MNCKDVKYYLNDYLNGMLIDEMRREIEIHINICHSCKKKYEELLATLNSSGSRKKIIHPVRDFREGISEINENDSDIRLPDVLFSPHTGRDDPRYKVKSRKKHLLAKWIAIGAPTASVLLAVLISVLYYSKTPTAFWQVENLKGTPMVGDVKLEGSGILPLGDWLKTDASSSARLKAGMIGNVDVKSGSEIRLVETDEKEYKLYLKVGKISAKTWASPNIFKVETPTGEATDLGCAFTLEVDKDGSSLLHVTKGWAALKSGKDKSILPAGTSCSTRKNIGSGTPYSDSASIDFKTALKQLDFENGGEEALKAAVASAKSQDAFSLWYLLNKVKPGEKKIIYDRLAEFVPPPENVTLNGIMDGNTEMFLSWWGKLGCGSKTLWNY
jgi:hypothetical protein